MNEEEISMKIVNPRAADVDIGIRSHWVASRLKIALRRAANAIGNLKDSTSLSDFFKRINF